MKRTFIATPDRWSCYYQRVVHSCVYKVTTAVVKQCFMCVQRICSIKAVCAIPLSPIRDLSINCLGPSTKLQLKQRELSVRQTFCSNIWVHTYEHTCIYVLKYTWSIHFDIWWFYIQYCFKCLYNSQAVRVNKSYFSVPDLKISVPSFVEVFCVRLFTFQPSVIQRHGWLSSTLLVSSLPALCVKYASASDRLHFFQSLGKWATDEIWRLLHYTPPHLFFQDAAQQLQLHIIGKMAHVKYWKGQIKHVYFLSSESKKFSLFSMFSMPFSIISQLSVT